MGPGAVLCAAALAAAGCGSVPREPEGPAAVPPDLRGTLVAAFEPFGAVSLVAFLEERFRLPGNAPYRESLDEIDARLRFAGFGRDDRLRIERWTLQASAATWEPLAASIELIEPVREEVESFRSGSDVERTMLLIGSPGTGGPVDLQLVDEAGGDPAGRAVLARGLPSTAYERLAGRKAGAVLISADARLEGPPSSDDAIPFGEVEGGPSGPPAFVLSRRAEGRLRALLRAGKPVVLRVSATVRAGRAPVEAVHAEVVGGGLPGLVFLAHVDEPGAEDNASGVAVSAGIAVAVAGVIVRSDGASATRSVHFLFGPEFDQAIDASRRLDGRLGWGVALDQVARPVGGDSGTRALVERPPDPSRSWPVDVAAGSGWDTSVGGVPAPPGAPGGSFVADVVLGFLRDQDPRWESHPFEGGSDHEPLIAFGVPAALVWKFPDPTYHTHLDRLGPSVVSSVEVGVVGRAMLDLAAAAAFEDGSRVAEAAVEAVAGRLRMLEGGADATAAARCAWGGWLREAVEDARRFVGAGSSVGAAASDGLADVEARARALMGFCAAPVPGTERDER